MKHALLLLPVLLAACGQGEDRMQNNQAAAASAAPEPVELSTLELEGRSVADSRRSGRQRRELEGRVRGAMEADFFDPFSAQFRNVRPGRNGAVCGQVNARNRMGAYVGFRDFVLGRDGRTVYVSGTNSGVRFEQYSSFAEAYLNVCASGSEAANYRRSTGISNPSVLRAPLPPLPDEDNFGE